MNLQVMSRRPYLMAGSQRGAVLVVSLLLLLVMTLLGLGASQSTRLQERMAGNQRDLEVAMQSAEAGLRAAEELLQPTRVVLTCVTPTNGCAAYERATLVDQGGQPLDLTGQSATWWQQWGDVPDFSDDLLSVTPPQFVIEWVAEVRDSLSQGGSTPVMVRDFYRSTARSSGTTDTAEVVVQSTFARLGFE